MKIDVGNIKLCLFGSGHFYATNYVLKTVGTLLVSLYTLHGKTKVSSESFCSAGAFTCSVCTLTMLIEQQS